MAPPTAVACRLLLDEHGVPEHIRRHSEQVARLVRFLARGLNDSPNQGLDVERLEAAALLHDISKAECFQSHRDHAAEGARVLRGLGYLEIADLVERHVDLGEWDPEGRVTEAEILNYCDKRVRHEEVVDLAARFEDLLERYGGFGEQARRRIESNRRTMEALEQKIFARLPFGPSRLGEDTGE